MKRYFLVHIVLVGAVLSGASRVLAATPCPSLFPTPGYKTAYCSNIPLDTSSAAIKRLVVVIHGTNRNAKDYYTYVNTAREQAGANDTLVIAPQFMNSSEARNSGHPSDTLYWSTDGWKYGDLSVNEPRTSAFAVVDEIIRYITSDAHFPNISRVVVTGHSAGGQFVNRYASGSELGASIPTTGYTVKFAIANPSSYMYLSPERPANGSLTTFSLPSSADRIACPYYNYYKYGLEHLDINPYMERLGEATLTERYREREVTYMLGANDTNPQDSTLDTSCGAIMQGAHRLQRGTAFYNYLGNIFGSQIYTRHVKRVVAGVGHDGNKMFNSPEGSAVFFEQGTAVLIPPKPGDCNGDGVVTIIDYSMFIADYGTSHERSDFDHSGTVDIYDFTALLANFGK